MTTLSWNVFRNVCLEKSLLITSDKLERKKKILLHNKKRYALFEKFDQFTPRSIDQMKYYSEYFVESF